MLFRSLHIFRRNIDRFPNDFIRLRRRPRACPWRKAKGQCGFGEMFVLSEKADEFLRSPASPKCCCVWLRRDLAEVQHEKYWTKADSNAKALERRRINYGNHGFSRGAPFLVELNGELKSVKILYANQKLRFNIPDLKISFS